MKGYNNKYRVVDPEMKSKTIDRRPDEVDRPLYQVRFDRTRDTPTTSTHLPDPHYERVMSHSLR